MPDHVLDLRNTADGRDAAVTLASVIRRSGRAEIARAAILALTAWQTPDPIPDLFAVAKGDSNLTRQILAVRGLIKLIQTPSDRSPEETVGLLAEVMQLAKQPQEKRAILSVLPNYPVKAALALAEAASNDAAVAREAKVAAGQLRDVLPR